MITIYHNPRCRKSREVLALLDEMRLPYTTRLYLKEPPSKAEISALLKQLDVQPLEMIRKNESVFKEQHKGKQYTKDQWISIIADNPILIERPIVIKDNKAVIGRPSSKVVQLLNN